MTATAAHAGIDGSVVTIEAGALDAGMQASSVAVFTIDGRWQEFTASYLDFGAEVADDLGVRLAESYRFQGGTLRLGSTMVRFPATETTAAQTDLLHLGVWEGRDFSVHTHLYNGAAHDLIQIFERFHIIEQPLGIRLVPTQPQRTPLAKEPMVLREVPDVGLLQITPLTPRVARTVPKWRGTQLAGGELYRGQRPGDLHFVLVGARSHTLIMRGGEDCTKQELSQLSRLRVDWLPAAGG